MRIQISTETVFKCHMRDEGKKMEWHTFSDLCSCSSVLILSEHIDTNKDCTGVLTDFL